MKVINKGNGIFTVESERDGDTNVRESLFYKNLEAREIHFPEGVTAIDRASMPYCYNLEKVYMPSTLKKLGDEIFRGIISRVVEIYYNGTSKQFKKLAAPFVETVTVNVSGPYDHYPYYSSEGSYTKEEKQVCSFDASCAEIEVICKDGIKLYYGFSNYEKKKLQ